MGKTDKFKELIIYLARESEGDDHFGMVKLNKLLFNIDFLAYRRFGQSVTGQEYQALPFGPAPRSVLPVLNSMEEDGDVAIREETLYGYTQKRPLALRQADIHLFSQDEIALIAHLLLRFRDMSAKQISELSHNFLGWSLANEGETIPYAVALLGREELTEQELDHAKIAEVRARKWLAERAA
jgi:uncharacterized phage-associated protein